MHANRLVLLLPVLLLGACEWLDDQQPNELGPVEPGDSSDLSADDEDPGAADSEPESCAPVAVLSCGDVFSGDTSDWNDGASSVLDGYPVGIGDWTAPEIIFALDIPAGVVATAKLVDAVPSEVDHDLILLRDEEGQCRADAAVARGFHSLEIEGAEGPLPFLVVDGFAGDVGAFELSIECEQESAPEDEEPSCLSFDSTMQESAPVQTAAPVPESAWDRDWVMPSTFTSWVDFNGDWGAAAVHEGIDAIHDDEFAHYVAIRTIADGEVVYVRSGCPQSDAYEPNQLLRECGSGWGNHVIVSHGDGLFSRYAHLAPQEIDVKVGDLLDAGDIIGGMGNSGRSQLRHLHLELGSSTEAFDPCAPTRSFEAVHPLAPLGIAP